MQQIWFGIVHAANKIAVIAIICCVIAVALALFFRRNDRPKQRRFYIFLVVASIGLLIFGLFMLVWYRGGGVPIPSPSSDRPQCVKAMITVEGSTAMYSLVQDLADSYMKKYCPSAQIMVANSPLSGGGSEIGVSGVETDTVESNTTAKTPTLASSDCVCIGDTDVVATTFGARYSNLDDHVVAAVQYVLVVDSHIGISNLTTDEIKNIYASGGTYTNWDQVNLRKNLPIVYISRDTTSGTRITFDQYVLGGGSEKPPLEPADQVNSTEAVMQRMLRVQGGIGYVTLQTALAYQTKYPGKFTIINIDGHPYSDYSNNSYQFWALEHMYTNSARASDSPPSYKLAQAFIDYMGNTNTVPNIIHNHSFLTVGDVSDILYTHY